MSDRQSTYRSSPIPESAGVWRSLGKWSVGCALFAALLDIDVYRSMRRQGFGTAEAAERIATLITLATEPTPGAERRST